MKINWIVYLPLLFLICSCAGVPDSPKLDVESESKIAQIRKELKAETMFHRYTRKTSLTEDKSKLYFDVILYDIDKNIENKVSLDSMNYRILEIYKQNGYELNSCYRISIYYYQTYKKAKLVKGYYLDREWNVTEVFYH